MSNLPSVHPSESTDSSDDAQTVVVTKGEVREIIRWVSARRHVELTLYGSVTLIAAILATRISGTAVLPIELFAVIWASALGLAIAHWFAASVAGRVSSPARLPMGHYVDTLVQSYPLIIAAVVASVGGLVGYWLGDDVQSTARGADIALIALCAIVAWAGASSHGAPYRKRLSLTLFVVAFASVISGAKLVLGH